MSELPSLFDWNGSKSMIHPTECSFWGAAAAKDCIKISNLDFSWST